MRTNRNRCCLLSLSLSLSLSLAMCPILFGEKPVPLGVGSFH